MIRSLIILYLHLYATYIVSAQLIWNFDGTPADILLGSSQHSLAACDINGDGYKDLVAGSTGYVFVFHGSSAGFASSPNKTLTGSGFFGVAVTCCHTNSDSYDDVIVGDYANSVARVYLGGAGGVNTTSSFSVTGVSASNFGVSLTCGDMNGDGYDDLAVGANAFANGQTNEGAVYVYYASSFGSGLTTSGSVTIEGNDAGAGFGNILACGPINGDSYSDLIVGAPSATTAAGRVEIFAGSASGVQTTPLWTKNGTFSGNKVGSSISVRGDVNQDGIHDIAIGSYQLVEIYLGNATIKSTPDASFSFPSTDTVTCAIVPDTNKDFYDDIFIGEPAFGRARLYRGSELPLTNITTYVYTSGTGSGAGTNVYGLGDIDGDSAGDLVLSDPNYATSDGRVTAIRQLAPSASPTPSVTPSVTPSTSASPSITPSPSATASITPTTSATPSGTPTASLTPSPSKTPTPSRTPARTPSPTASPSITPGLCAPPKIINCGTLCTDDPADCVTISPCTDETPFECSDGTCVDSASGCDESSCGSQTLCWDGSCAPTVEDCSPVTSCPATYPLRCWNGCFPANSNCTMTSCAATQVACVDGSCVNSQGECPDYNGCGLGLVDCPSGLCAASAADCECKDSTQTGTYQCFESGCSASCKLPPWRVKVATYTATIFASSSTVPLTDSNGNSVGTISVEANTFSDTVKISIGQVPDSVILGSKGVVAIVAPAVSLELSESQNFSSPIEICFEYTLPDGTTLSDLSDACLMTLNSLGNWECHSKATISGNSICGFLTHFSDWSFGILESSIEKSSDPGFPLWALIVIVVGGAVVLGGTVTLVVVLIWKKKKRAEEYEMY